MWNEKDFKQQGIIDAKKELTEIEAIKVLLTNNHLACEIHISGIKFGLCNTKKVIPALNYHKKEIEKFIKGEKNEWE